MRIQALVLVSNLVMYLGQSSLEVNVYSPLLVCDISFNHQESLSASVSDFSGAASRVSVSLTSLARVARWRMLVIWITC